MRSDMSKVLVERPRLGRSWAKANQGDRFPRNLEDSPKRAPKCPDKTKGLNENLGPLKRYLRSQVGRKWDDVYSDISKHLRPSNPVQQHVRDHLKDFVCMHTSFENGIPREKPHGYSWCDRMVRYFYVCPHTGSLCEHLTARKKGGLRSLGKRGCRCEECQRRVDARVL